MKPRRVFVVGLGVLSAAGRHPEAFWQAHLEPNPVWQARSFNGKQYPVASLPPEAEEQLRQLQQSDRRYRSLDRATLMGILAARQAWQQAQTVVELSGANRIGVQWGSSRGATATWEAAHSEFTHSHGERVPLLASPTTTLGNLSSWVALDLGLTVGPVFSHSITCSTSHFALGNALAWLRSGMADALVVGGAEAPLTAFTIAQLSALRVVRPVRNPAEMYPSRPFDPTSDSMLLGEGAAALVLLAAESPPVGAFAEVLGFGFGMEPIPHAAGITEQGLNLQRAMQLALQDAQHTADTALSVDLVVAHAPGTSQGDSAEVAAARSVWGNQPPQLYSSKWLTGHTLGASGALSSVLAVGVLQKGGVLSTPYSPPLHTPVRGSTPAQVVMVNGVGFGGVAASVVFRSLST